MLAAGILALFSISLVGMMSSDDTAETDTQDVTPEAPDTEEVAEEIVIPETPVSAEVAPAEEAAPTETSQVTESLPEATVEPTVEPAVAAEEPPAPEFPASVILADGSVINAETIMSDGPLTGAQADRDFLLDAPTGAHAIDVAYDADTTYAIAYSEDTLQINAALNSNITGPDGAETRITLERVDDSGNAFTDTIITRTFETGPQIELHVDQSFVGDHVAEIDLSNPEASLDFYFTWMEHAVHRFYDEQDRVEGDSVITTRTLYIVETDFGLPQVPEDSVRSIVANGFDVTNETRLIAEVHLGHSVLTLGGDGSNAAPHRQTIGNFINEDPDIDTNFRWVSNTSTQEMFEDRQTSTSGFGGLLTPF